MGKFGVFLYEGFQEMEFWYPVLRLREIGADVAVIGVAGQEAASSVLGYPVVPDRAMSDCAPGDYAALVVPGGKVDGLAANERFLAFVREASQRGARVLTATQAAPLVPGALVAPSTDELPQAMRKLLRECAQ